MSSNNGEMEQKKTNQAIDRQIEEDKKRLRKEIKLLLLGTSTINRSPTLFDWC